MRTQCTATATATQGWRLRTGTTTTPQITKLELGLAGQLTIIPIMNRQLLYPKIVRNQMFCGIMKKTFQSKNLAEIVETHSKASRSIIDFMVAPAAIAIYHNRG